MTSEICLMNRRAVVLAADSATTVTRWNGTEREERYFKGANKVFQLSIHDPIGLMIYDSASIHKVPWEVVIKEFRSHLGSTSHTHVKGYAEAFFQFLDESDAMFPKEEQDQTFHSAVLTCAFRRIISQKSGDSFKPEEQQKHADAVAKALNKEVSQFDIHRALEHADLTEWRKTVVAKLEDALVEFDGKLGPKKLPTRLTDFASDCVELVIRKPELFLSTTGLVFAGYGREEFFPSIVEYQSCGMIAGKHIANEERSDEITHSKPAWVSGFAQTSMIDTFEMGISREVYNDVASSVSNGLKELRTQITKALGSGKTVTRAIENADFNTVFESAREKICQQVLNSAMDDNVAPMRDVLSSLPLEEMAELAETLINLQSLKEKVTKPSETVGGPVDVAVITKSEGLVWVKRKHYFDGKLNSRYGYRTQMEHQ